MLEIPECQVIADQLNQTIMNKRIKEVIVNASAHKFAFFMGDQHAYPLMLKDRRIGKSQAFGGFIQISAEDVILLFNDGANLRYYPDAVLTPDKHQLKIVFHDDSCLLVTIQMYGGIGAVSTIPQSNRYYWQARQKPGILTDQFSAEYFMTLIDQQKRTLSLKALLACEQRLPGLGNGVLQDVLFKARMNPKTLIGTLDQPAKERLYQQLRQTLNTMISRNGRDTEKDLFNHSGGYQTVMSAKNIARVCPQCQGKIIKETYLGGSVYYCPHCQPMIK